jgi:hypothetical protein
MSSPRAKYSIMAKTVSAMAGAWIPAELVNRTGRSNGRPQRVQGAADQLATSHIVRFGAWIVSRNPSVGALFLGVANILSEGAADTT